MSNVIQFPVDRVRSSSTVTVVDGTGPFIWYSTPSQTDQLEEQSARVLKMMEESFEPV